MNFLTGIVALCIAQLGVSLPVENYEVPAAQTISRAANTFSPYFYQNVAEMKLDQNIVTSPLSAYLALNMAALGAEGKTKEILQKGLHLKIGDMATYGGLATLTRVLNDEESLGVTLKSVSNIFTSKDITPKEKFQQMLQFSFNSGSQSVDFNDKEKAAKIINDWVAHQTNHKIKEIMEPDSVEPSTIMALLNTVYFNGNWTFPFNKENTALEPFYSDQNTHKSVHMMHKEADFIHGRVPNLPADYVILPYGPSGLVTMTIVVPDEVNGLRHIEQNLHLLRHVDLYNLNRNYTVDISLPRFKIENTLNLAEPLSKMGMADIFSTSADFGGIVDQPITLSNIVQKAFIEVNESGTEAAAVTDIGISLKFGGDKIIVNKPSLIIIRINNVDLFIARLYNPTA